MFDDLLGKEFEYNGRGPDKYDCYGLAIEVARRAGIDFPAHPSYTTFEAKDAAIKEGLKSWKQLSTPKPFCLVTFCIRPPWVSHVGVVLEYNRFIHIQKNTRVTIERFDRDPWKLKVRGFYEWQG